MHRPSNQPPAQSIITLAASCIAVVNLQYDRSGRSTGIATVLFTNARDAKLAQRQLDGVLAKGNVIDLMLEHVLIV